MAIEQQLTPEWLVRAGYSYGKSQVPDSTLTPMTAAISEHAIGLGLGCEADNFSLGLAYQLDLPASQSSNHKPLNSSGYDFYKFDLQASWIGVTLSRKF